MPTRRRAREEPDELANQAPRTRLRRSGAAPAISDAEGAISSGPEADSASHESMQPAPRVEGSTSHSQDRPQDKGAPRQFRLKEVARKHLSGSRIHEAAVQALRAEKSAPKSRQHAEQVRLPVARVTADAAVCPETFQKRLIGWILTLVWGLRLRSGTAQARFGTLVSTLVKHVLVTLATHRGTNRGKHARNNGRREVNSHCCRKWILTLS